MQKKALALLKDSRFTEAAWNKKTTQGKKDMLTAFLKEIDKILHTSVNLNIVYKALEENIGGQYSHKSKSIILNSKSFNYNFMYIVLHELRHAYQFEAIDQNLRHIVSEETRKKWKENFDNYKYPKDGEAAYYQQPVEWDAYYFSDCEEQLEEYKPVYTGSWG